ncbi:hypothetical protein [Dyella choica]|uniref:Uncharacterized protein n=1 Tax=Dyella choica TaxID=1927959 RepID=A0A432M7N4_9GAMM|nr:hypothetical protein [Dyella choica]RUL77522.1 hypothetical protein EKH80_06435 [Dyella choica]
MGYSVDNVKAWIGEATLTKWTQMSVTNIPKPDGGYTYTADNLQATNTSGAATAWIAGKVKELKSDVSEFGGAQMIGGFWIKLGAITEKTKIGRCLHMSGLAVFHLLDNTNFDNVTIQVVGSTVFDHHFVLLDIYHAGDKKKQCFVVDIWQGRVDKSNNFVYTDASHPYYRHGKLKTYFEFVLGASQRQLDRSLITQAKQVN